MWLPRITATRAPGEPGLVYGANSVSMRCSRATDWIDCSMKCSEAKRLALVKARRYGRASNGGTSGMERRFVKIERGLGPQGRIAVVHFDRGDNINALSRQAMRELRDVPREFEDDLETTVVILTGSAKAFSAGFDLKDPEGSNRGKLPLGEPLLNQRLGPRLCKAWEQLEQVTIAAIEGHCIGGGAALAVSLDFRFCGKAAHFRIPEVELGMNMSWGSIPRLVALMGPARTKQAVILASDRIGAAEALDWGLDHRLL